MDECGKCGSKLNLITLGHENKVFCIQCAINMLFAGMVSMKAVLDNYIYTNTSDGN